MAQFLGLGASINEEASLSGGEYDASVAVKEEPTNDEGTPSDCILSAAKQEQTYSLARSDGAQSAQTQSEPKSPASIDTPPSKLFVGGLSWQTTTEKLRDYFSAFGTVTDVLIMKDPVTQRSRGFGFITFKDQDGVDRVLQVSNHTLDGKKIDPKYATPRNGAKKPLSASNGYEGHQGPSGSQNSGGNGSMNTKKIFVGGLSQDTTVDEIKQYFSQFGTVEEAVLLMDNQTKRHRGFGFVTMASEAVVDRICDIHYHVIKAKKVECKKALPREAVAAASAAATAAAVAVQQPNFAYLIARQRLAAQALTGGMLTNGFGGGFPMTAPATPALFQLYEGLMSPQGHGSGILQSSPHGGAGVNPVVSSPQLTASTNASVSYGKILSYQGASAAHRYAPYPSAAAISAAHANSQAGMSNSMGGGVQGNNSMSYPGNYTLPATVDLSALQGFDWSAMTGLPAMYAA